MAVNVTQKDKTLNDVIDWCEKHAAQIDEKIPDASDEGFLAGERFALQTVAAHCESMLGYSGSMPSEVPNQSEDAKKNEKETGSAGYYRKTADRTGNDTDPK